MQEQQPSDTQEQQPSGAPAQEKQPASPHGKRMTLRFAFAKPAHAIATFFGSGLARRAPGTWGTLAGLVVYMALERWVPAHIWWILVVVTFFLGAWASEVTGHDIEAHDHSSIVIDEVFAIWLVLLLIPEGIRWQVAAFLLFRFFDIMKLPPADYFDTAGRWQNGWGVMLDDAMAALQTVCVLYIGRLCLWLVYS